MPGRRDERRRRSVNRGRSSRRTRIRVFALGTRGTGAALRPEGLAAGARCRPAAEAGPTALKRSAALGVHTSRATIGRRSWRSDQTWSSEARRTAPGIKPAERGPKFAIRTGRKRAIRTAAGCAVNAWFWTGRDVAWLSCRDRRTFTYEDRQITEGAECLILSCGFDQRVAYAQERSTSSATNTNYGKRKGRLGGNLPRPEGRGPRILLDSARREMRLSDRAPYGVAAVRALTRYGT